MSMDISENGENATGEVVTPPDATVSKEQTGEDNGNPYIIKPIEQEIAEAKAAEDGTKGENEGVTPEAQQEFNEVVKSWKEDRENLSKFEKENSELRDMLAQTKNKLSQYESDEEDEEDKELEGLSRADREAKIVERHNQRKADEQTRIATEVEKEKSFMRASEPFYKENEKAVLANAVKFDCKTLEQAVKITKEITSAVERAEKARLIEEKRKLDASGVQPTGTTGNTTPRNSAYNPDTDRSKSIRDLYRGL